MKNEKSREGNGGGDIKKERERGNGKRKRGEKEVCGKSYYKCLLFGTICR